MKYSLFSLFIAMYFMGSPLAIAGNFYYSTIPPHLPAGSSDRGVIMEMEIDEVMFAKNTYPANPIVLLPEIFLTAPTYSKCKTILKDMNARVSDVEGSLSADRLTDIVEATAKDLMRCQIKSCTDTDLIDSFSRQENLEFQREINECRTERALEECNLDFLEVLSGSDKVTHRARLAECRGEQAVTTDREVSSPAQPPVTVTSFPQSQVSVPPVVPSVAPARAVDVSATADTRVGETVPEESDDATSSTATENDEDVSKDGQETTPDSMEEKKPQRSFFGRIFNFFQSLF